jgi:outer membrane receptor for ferrienterochelin and colicin
MKSFIIALYLLLTALYAHAQTGSVKGRVYNVRNNEPIPFANIIIYGEPTQGTTSDANGNFLLKGVRTGYTKLVASFVGYEKTVTEDFLVTLVHPVEIDIPMNEMSVKLKEVEVKSSPFIRKIESPVSLQTLSIQEIEKNPGANRDISKVIQSLPGVSSTAAFRNDVIVRGGGPGENRFYLDGVEIPNLNHFSTQGASGGPIGIINSDFIREVDFYAGAFPSNRSNALSSVIEFRQIDGNQEQWNFHGTLGATDLAFTSDGPVTKNSNILFSVRRSYLKFLFDILGLPFLPVYNDYQLKYKWNINQRNQFTLISIGSLDKSTLNTGIKNPDDSQRYILGYLPENDQWSYTIGGVYRHFRPKGSDVIVMSRNMLDNRALKYQNNIETSDNLVLDYQSVETENKIRYEATREIKKLKVHTGAEIQYSKYSNNTFQKTFIGGQVQPITYVSHLDFFRYGLFGQGSQPLFDGKLSVSFGLRLDANTYSAGMSSLQKQLSPRLSASYTLARQWYLNMNIGRYFQLPAYTSLGYRDNNGELANIDHLRYIRADHAVTGIEYRPGENSRITLEGFYKIYRDYPLSVTDGVSLASKGADYGVYGDELLRSDSKGKAYGAELSARNKNLKKWNILATLTLVRSEFTNAAGTYLPSSWDNKLLFSTTISRSLKKNWDIGLKWRWVGGAPYTPYDMDKSSRVDAWDIRNQAYLDYGRFNSLRLHSFQQLDIRVDKSFFFSSWTLLLYLDIQNLYNYQAEKQDFVVNYDERGIVTRYTDSQGVDRYVLRSVPSTYGTVLPSVGVMIEF